MLVSTILLGFFQTGEFKTSNRRLEAIHMTGISAHRNHQLDKKQATSDKLKKILMTVVVIRQKLKFEKSF